MARHGTPSAGKTPDGNPGRKPTKAEARVQRASGSWMWKATAAIFGSKTKKPKKP